MSEKTNDKEMLLHKVLADYGGHVQQVNQLHHHENAFSTFGQQFVVGSDIEVVLTLSFRDNRQIDRLFSDFSQWVTEKEELQKALDSNPELKEAYEHFLVLRKLYGV